MSNNQPEYCMYTGEKCIHCNKCQVIPQQVIYNNKSSNWGYKIAIILLILFMIIVIFLIIPAILNNTSPYLIEYPTDNSDTSPTYISNYEPHTSYSESSSQSHYDNPVTSTSNNYQMSSSSNGYVVNTSGEAYNPMR